MLDNVCVNRSVSVRGHHLQWCQEPRARLGQSQRRSVPPWDHRSVLPHLPAAGERDFGFAGLEIVLSFGLCLHFL